MAPPLLADGPEPLANEDHKSWRQRWALFGLDYAEGRVRPVPEEARRIAATPDARAAGEHARLGRELLAENANLEAIAAFTRAVLLDPGRGEHYLGLGEALLTRKGWEERALAAFRTGLDHAPESAHLRYRHGDALWRTGELEPAIAELREAVRLDPELGLAWNRLATALFLRREPAGAGVAMERAEALGAPVPPRMRAALAPTSPEADAGGR